MIGGCLPVDADCDCGDSRLGGQLIRRRPMKHAQFRVSRASRFTDIAFPPSFARGHSDAYYRIVACVPIWTRGTVVRRGRSAPFEPWADRLTGRSVSDPSAHRDSLQVGPPVRLPSL